MPQALTTRAYSATLTTINETPEEDILAERPNLDFSKGVRSKYYNRLAEGTNIAILDPALLEHFPDSQSVNIALHAFLSLPAEERAAAIRQTRSKVGPAAEDFDPPWAPSKKHPDDCNRPVGLVSGHTPAAPELLLPILKVVPLQLLAYHIAVRRGCDVDRPWNLAKSVTGEK